ncbi:hypothetical protein LTR17_016994 [Elasticomyces elasticus]|nr:hypothetical protein LTR17_016994 [Elasticomyces elasticus]
MAAPAPDYFNNRPAAPRSRPSILPSQQRTGGTPGSPRTPLLGRSISAQFGTGSPGSFRGSEPEEVIIYELGSRHISAGFAGESRPRCILPFTPDTGRRVGDYRQYDARFDRRRGGSGKRKDWSRDHELYSTLDLRNQDLGLVSDKLERAVRTIHADYLQLAPSKDKPDLKAILVVPSLLPTPLIEVALKVLFNHHTTPPAIAMLTTPILATVGAGLRNALVIEVGREESVVTAVGEYKAVHQRRSVRAGKMMVSEMARVLGEEVKRQVTDMSGQILFEHAEDMMQRMGWCRPRSDVGSELLAATKSIPLPTTHSSPISVSLETLSSPAETVLFGQDSRYDDEDVPLPRLAHAVLLALPSDFRASCLSRIVLTGGLGDLPGLQQRLLRELHRLIEQNPSWDKVASYGSAEPKHNRVLRERSANIASTPQPSDASLSPTKKPARESLPASQRVHDDAKDTISQTAMRNHNIGRHKPEDAKKAELRGVATLSAWAGASLVARLGVKGVHEVEREEFLRHGLSGGGAVY